MDLLELIDNIKEKISDNEYLTIVDSIKNIYDNSPKKNEYIIDDKRYVITDDEIYMYDNDNDSPYGMLVGSVIDQFNILSDNGIYLTFDDEADEEHIVIDNHRYDNEQVFVKLTDDELVPLDELIKKYKL